MPISTQSNRVTGCLLLLNFVLVAVITTELQGTIDVAPGVSAAPPARFELEPEPELIEFQPPPRELFADIVDRPLFLPSRRPYVPPKVEPLAAAVERVAVKLLGTFLTDMQRLALVRLGTQAQAVWVREGELLSSWRVERIFRDRVVLRGDDEAQIVALWPSCLENTADCHNDELDRHHATPTTTGSSAR